MNTKKLLVRFNPKAPDKASSDFVVPVQDGEESVFFGLKSRRASKTGVMVYVGREVSVNDLFARLVDSGRRIENVHKTLDVLQDYIQMLQHFRIGNVITIEVDTVSGFRLQKLHDIPPRNYKKRLP
jgi:hypothetical protein